MMNFDRLAPWYDWLETLAAGQVMQRARTHWLSELVSARRVLSAGEGHGRFAAAFCRAAPSTSLTCVEASDRMLAQARRRVPPDAAIEWVVADLPGYALASQHYDAIVTCYFLDLFPADELRTVITALAAAATADARWLVVDFTLPPGGLGRLRARAIHALLYWFFRQSAGIPARTLTPPDPLLREAGFVLVRRQAFSWGLIRADLWERPSH